MSDQPTTPEPKDSDTPCRCGGRRPSSCSTRPGHFWMNIGRLAIYVCTLENIKLVGIGWRVKEVKKPVNFDESNDQADTRHE